MSIFEENRWGGPAETEGQRQYLIGQAREYLERLRTGYLRLYDPDNLKVWLLDNLRRAGVDAAVLDPEGKTSAAEMQDIIDQAYQAALRRGPSRSDRARD
jgi:hypothetical protein